MSSLKVMPASKPTNMSGAKISCAELAGSVFSDEQV